MTTPLKTLKVAPNGRLVPEDSPVFHGSYIQIKPSINGPVLRANCLHQSMFSFEVTVKFADLLRLAGVNNYPGAASDYADMLQKKSAGQFAAADLVGKIESSDSLAIRLYKVRTLVEKNCLAVLNQLADCRKYSEGPPSDDSTDWTIAITVTAQYAEAMAALFVKVPRSHDFVSPDDALPLKTNDYDQIMAAALFSERPAAFVSTDQPSALKIIDGKRIITQGDLEELLNAAAIEATRVNFRGAPFHEFEPRTALTSALPQIVIELREEDIVLEPLRSARG